MNGLRGIYVIVNEGVPDPVDVTRAALEGGVRIVQYRAKNGPVLSSLQRLRELTKEFGALFIVNDSCELARTSGADGVHLGPEDAEPAQLPAIRQELGALLLGLSCGTVAEARAAESAGADYIGVGPVFATNSKDDAGDPIGTRGLLQIMHATKLPVAAIGGITAQNLIQVAGTGVQMAAVISAIAQQGDMRAAASALVNAWETQ